MGQPKPPIRTIIFTHREERIHSATPKEIRRQLGIDLIRQAQEQRRKGRS